MTNATQPAPKPSSANSRPPSIPAIRAVLHDRHLFNLSLHTRPRHHGAPAVRLQGPPTARRHWRRRLGDRAAARRHRRTPSSLPPSPSSTRSLMLSRSTSHRHPTPSATSLSWITRRRRPRSRARLRATHGSERTLGYCSSTSTYVHRGQTGEDIRTGLLGEDCEQMADERRRLRRRYGSR